MPIDSDNKLEDLLINDVKKVQEVNEHLSIMRELTPRQKVKIKEIKVEHNKMGTLLDKFLKQ